MAKKKTPAGLHLQEVEALARGMKHLPNAVNNLIDLTNSKNESQRRQALEVYLRYFLADRGLQMQADGTVVSGGNTNITISKVDMQILNVMEKLPPQLQTKYAEVMDEIERYATKEDIEIFAGDIPGQDAVCACGCGEPVKKGRKWRQGHHLRAEVASDVIKAQRDGQRLAKAGAEYRRKLQAGEIAPKPKPSKKRPM